MKKIFSGFGLFAVLAGVLAVSTGTALAYRGDPAVKGPNYTGERHEAMTKAFLDADYDAWKELMQNRGRVSQVVTEANFPKFVEAHKLMMEGKYDEAKKIRQELGLGLRDGSGYKGGVMMGSYGHGMRSDINR